MKMDGQEDLQIGQKVQEEENILYLDHDNLLIWVISSYLGDLLIEEPSQLLHENLVLEKPCLLGLKIVDIALDVDELTDEVVLLVFDTLEDFWIDHYLIDDVLPRVIVIGLDIREILISNRLDKLLDFLAGLVAF